MYKNDWGSGNYTYNIDWGMQYLGECILNATPGIFRWPGRIPRGVTLDTPTSLMDLLPTLLSLADLPRLHTLVPRAADKVRCCAH